LCPTDFSDVATNAIAYAGKFAKEINAEVTLLNVKSIYELVPAGIAGNANAVHNNIKGELEKQCEEVHRVFKVPCVPDYQVSGIPLSLAINSRSKGHDLIIMGTNGPDDIYEFFAGSNTYNVIKKSSIPVLLIPDGFTYDKIESMVYAFDYFHEKTLPMKQLAPLVKDLDARLTVLQVLDELLEKNSDDKAKEIQKIINGEDNEFGLLFDLIYSSNIVDSIDRYALRNGGALAVCTRHHNFIRKLFRKNVIKTLSSIAAYPLFVFHE